MKHKIEISLFALILTMMGLSACGTVPTSAPNTTTPPASAAKKTVQELGAFKAENVNGDIITPEIFSNYDLTMVNLWVTTCGYCIQEMPDLELIRSEMQDEGVQFNVIGICLDAGTSGNVDQKQLVKVNEVIQKTGIQYETLIPDDVLVNGRLASVHAFPETFFVNREGQIVGETVLGANKKEAWQKIIDAELANV